MISPTIDKKEYIETIKEEEEDFSLSYSNSLPTIKYEDEFKKWLVSSQWEYMKNNLKKNENPRTLVEVGDLYLLKSNYKKAIDYYQRSLVLDSDYILAYEKIITAYSLHGKYSEGDICFRKLLDMVDNRKDIFKKYALFKSEEFLIEKRVLLEEVFTILDKALHLNVDDTDLLNMRGFLKLNFEEKIEEAEKDFDRAINIKSNFMHALNNKGVCQFRKGDLNGAEKTFKDSLKFSTKDYPFMYQNLALVHLRQNNFKLSYDILQEAIKEKIRLSNSWEHLSGWLLIQLRKFEDASSWYLNKIKEEPYNELLLNNLGFCYLKMNFINEAEDYFKKSIDLSEKKFKKVNKIDIRSLKSYYNLSRIYLTRGNFEEIYNIINRIETINPEKDAFAIYLKGAILSSEKRYEEAKEKFILALEIEEKIPEIYPDYAFILESIDYDYLGAIKILEKALFLGFDHVIIYNNLAFSYIKNNNLDKAEKILNIFNYDKDKDIPAIFFATRGLLEIYKGNLDQGNKMYDKAIKKLDKKNADIARQIKLMENARFFIKKDMHVEAKKSLFDARNLPESYVNVEIDILEESMN